MLHCHLQLDERSEISATEAIDRAIAVGVEKLICVGTDAETSQQAVDIAVTAGERVRAVIGLHPHDAKNEIDSTVSVLEKSLLHHKKFVVGSWRVRSRLLL